MWAMVQSSITLFFRGKLFADPAMVVRQLAAGLIGGALQPYLFKDLRYR